MLNEFLFSHISKLVDITKPKIKALERLGIFEIKDLFFYKPSYYKYVKLLPKIEDVNESEEVIIKLQIIDIKYPSAKNLPLKILASDGFCNINLVFFNPVPNLVKLFQIGSIKYILGKIEYFDYIPQINHPEIIYDFVNRYNYYPVYPLTYGILNSQLWGYVKKILNYTNNLEEWLPENVIKDENLISFRDSIYKIHAIKSKIANSLVSIDDACKRLKYDECFANQISLAKIRKSRELNIGKSFVSNKFLQNQVLKNLNFELTDAQKRTITEIEDDQLSNNQMFRMLQGDVGSGKTLVALLTCLNVVAKGFQVAVMAPTDILARQHYEFFKKAISDINILENQDATAIIAYLSGSTKGKSRKKILELIHSSESKIIIGTHALFQEKVIFNNLAYIIVDEQHKFGVNQRLELINKGEFPDILIMTATPIPRSLTIALFGDMQVSILNQKPKNRAGIKTIVKPKDKIDEIKLFVKNKISQSERVYWICPLIEKKDQEETEKSNFILSNVVERYEDLKKNVTNEISLLHGKMKSEEKENAMQEFKNGITKILVSTTVVEVGVDVPEATIIIIENSERFGLAQLHQLRGRVGRGNLESLCILLYEKNTSQIGKERLKILKESNDGFLISEKDLYLRGGGEILGERQSGEENFNFLNLTEDAEIILKINNLVNKIDIENLDHKTQICLKLFKRDFSSSELKIV